MIDIDVEEDILEGGCFDVLLIPVIFCAILGAASYAIINTNQKEDKVPKKEAPVPVLIEKGKMVTQPSPQKTLVRDN